MFRSSMGMRTLAFRARNETTFHADGQQVPFYLQPTLGGPNDLRGYERYRYYGNGSLCSSGEYKWSVAEASRWPSSVRGNVYSRPGLIGLRELRGDGGSVSGSKTSRERLCGSTSAFRQRSQSMFVFNNAFGKLYRSS